MRERVVIRDKVKELFGTIGEMKGGRGLVELVGNVDVPSEDEEGNDA